MELRIRSARTTKDIDLTLHDGTRLAKDTEERRRQVRAMLQDSAASQLNDYFEFLVGEGEKIWTERPKVEAVTLSMLAWTGEDSRTFTST